MEVAKSIGTELYVIDAGWYGNEPNVWWKNVGDWHAGAWLPNGLEPVPERAHQLGMKFGLWVEVEAVGENSTLRREHPDWLYRRDGEPVASARALDLTNPIVAAWVQSEIERVIEQYKLDMFRIDHNHTLAPSGNRQVRWHDGRPDLALLRGACMASLSACAPSTRRWCSRIVPEAADGWIGARCIASITRN